MYKRFIYVAVLMLIYPKILFAADAGTILTNFIQALPNLTRMVTAIAYVIGMYMVIKGVLELKVYGEQRTMYSSTPSLKPALIYLVIGALLIFLPTSIDVGASTFWSEPCPYCYVKPSGQWSAFLSNCFLIIQFIGIIAFIRGLLLFTEMAHGQSGQQTFSKALTHIIGGLFCINIYQFIQLVFVTFGIPSPLSS